MRAKFRLRSPTACVLVLFCHTTALAQTYRPTPKPRLLSLQLTGGDLSLRVEGDSQNRRSYLTELTSKDDLISMTPSIGLSLNGSIYHPNLITFSLGATEGQTREYTTQTTGLTGESVFHNYHGHADIFQEKPYHLQLYINNSIMRRNYGFFTQSTVEDLYYGGHAGYTIGSVPVTISVSRMNEDTLDTTRPVSREESELAIRTSHSRHTKALTKLAYKLRSFETRHSGKPVSEGTRNLLTLSDNVVFGNEGRFRLSSSLDYDQLRRKLSDSSRFRLRESFSAEHGHNLRSGYRYSYSASDTQSSESITHRASASLSHKLYGSLRSSVRANGELSEADSNASDTDTYRYGAGINETYVKRLGEWGNLNLFSSFDANRGRNKITGDIVLVVDERADLVDGTVVALSEIDVDRGSILVTDLSSTIVYAEGLDYRITTRGQSTEIEREPGGLIPTGDTVLVSYTAAAQASDSFTSTRTSMGFRLDMADGLVGLYGRLADARNDAGSSLSVHDIVDKTVGIAVAHGNFRAGLEYQDYESSLTPYKAIRSFQRLTLRPSDRSVLSLDLTQSDASYPDTREDERRYAYIGRYNATLHPSMTFSLEAGMRIAEGKDLSRELITARTSLIFAMGKLETRIGYAFTEDDDKGAEFREDHRVYVNARRSLF